MPGDDLEKFPSLDTFKWRRPNNYNRRRRAIVFRLFVALLGLWAFYTLIAPSKLTEEKFSSSVTVDESSEDGLDPILNLPAVETPRTDNETTLRDQKGMGKLNTIPDATATKEPAMTEPRPWTRTNIETSLRRLLSLLPDELQVHTLLRPLETTGEARLRELGLRTRYFKKLFDAWEAVHLVPSEDGKGIYIRDDVVQDLQHHPNIAAALGMTPAHIIHSYEDYRSVITRLSTLLFPWTAPYSPDHIHLHSQFYRGGKGIVFTAGDHQAPFLLTSIPVIRQLGCHLPIEIFYLGDRDLSESVRTRLEALRGVTTRDLSQMVNDDGWRLAGWAGKPFAILHSSFREVIFIDADSLFFQNPERLFADEVYLQTGALFFKDRLIMPQSKRKWLQKVLPKPISSKVLESRFWTGQSGHMQESGVILVDKWRHFVALLLVTRMNGPDRDGSNAKQIVGVYDMVYGDKETFWLGWELVGDLDYAFHDGDAGIMGVVEKSGKTVAPENLTIDSEEDYLRATGSDSPTPTSPDNYTICAPQLLHLDTHGRPLWFNGWVLPNKYDKGDREPATFEAFLREPREPREGEGPDAWQLQQDNICCLTSEHKMEFTRDEREVLDLIVASGRRAGALRKGKGEKSHV